LLFCFIGLFVFSSFFDKMTRFWFSLGNKKSNEARRGFQSLLFLP